MIAKNGFGPGRVPLLRAMDLIGVGKSSHSPLPPNRACGSPAHGSPVSGFLIGIGSQTIKLRFLVKSSNAAKFAFGLPLTICLL